MRRQVLAAVRMIAVLTVLLGLAYPLAVTGVAQALFHPAANGSLVTDAEGRVVGSALVGQTFTSATYFHGRPSAAGPLAAGAPAADGSSPDPGDASLAVSGGSNLGPTNPTLLANVTAAADAYRVENGLAADTPVPVDAVTSSASGVDPDISVANARLQAPRVAAARNLPVEQVLALVDAHTGSPLAGFLGEPSVRVLELNLALDGAS